MSKFSVGDRVRFVMAGRQNQPVGHEAMVVGLDARGLPIVDNDLSGDKIGWPEEFLEVIGCVATINESATTPNITGGLNSYYLVRIDAPQRPEQPPYTAECEDIIGALDMTFDEANIFKEIWRSANARKGNGKPDHKALYGAQKIAHYAGRNLKRVESRE